MSLFAINTDNVFFLADNKMYSTGLVQMYEDAVYHVRSVPKPVISKVMEESRFEYISANTSSRIECNCAISNTGTFFSWGNNLCGQQGIVLLSLSDTEEETGDVPEADQSNEEGISESDEADWGGEEENGEYQDEEIRRYDGVTTFPPGSTHGEIFSCNPMRRGREHFCGETPASAVCSETAFFVVTDEGNVWCVGDDVRMHDLVRPDTPSHIFAKIPSEFFGGVAVASIAIGLEHMLAVCTEGFVWAWGSNSYCAAGVSKEIHFQSHPVKVHVMEWEHKRFSAVSAGDDFSVALDTDGILWEWGRIHALTRIDRRTGQTAISVMMSPSRVSWEEPDFISPIRKLSSGSTFTLVLDEAGRVWSFGMGDYGELGVERRQCARSLIPITEFANQHPLVSISSGQNNCGAVSCQGDVYTWGNNFYCDTRGKINSNLINGGLRNRRTCISTPMLVMVTHRFSQDTCTAFLMGLNSRLGAKSNMTNQIQAEIADMILQPTHQSVSWRDRASARF